MKLIFNIAILIFFLASCTQNLTGGSSDHGNANTIISIKNETGETIKGGTIKIVSTDFHPIKQNNDAYLKTFKIDTTGIITIEELPLDSYCIIAFTEDSLFSIATTLGLTLESDTVLVTLSESGTMSIPTDSLILDNNRHYFIDELKLSLDSLLVKNGLQNIIVPKGHYNIKSLSDSQLTDSLIFSDIIVEAGFKTDISIFPNKPQGPDTVSLGDMETFYSYFDYKKYVPWIQAEFIEYQFDWGDGHLSHWQNNMHASHYWNKIGVFKIRVHVRYNDPSIKEFSDTFLSYWSPCSAVVVVIDYD